MDLPCIYNAIISVNLIDEVHSSFLRQQRIDIDWSHCILSIGN